MPFVPQRSDLGDEFGFRYGCQSRGRSRALQFDAYGAAGGLGDARGGCGVAGYLETMTQRS